MAWTRVRPAQTYAAYSRQGKRVHHQHAYAAYSREVLGKAGGI
jgi:hypothetical protein